MRRNKFGNIKTTVDGICFASRAEARRWGELKVLMKAGAISRLRRQVSFLLAVNDIKICNYIADFEYWDCFRGWIYEDVKSAATAKLPLFKLKAKLMKAVHGIDITVVK